jgi:glycosyltransferase involved in cell wall biosynthesis
MKRLARWIAASLARRWKYRFRLSRYRVFMKLAEGQEPPRLTLFPEQKAIVAEALRLRKAFASLRSEGPVETVSVVIPHYNQPRFLGEAIESARAQSFPPAEIIVVDDLSTDPVAVREVEASFTSDPRVRFVYSREKLYAGGARQLGARESRGGAISFLDADDLMHPQRLELSKEVFDTHPDCAFVITSALPFSDSAPDLGAFRPSALAQSLIEPSALMEELARYFARMRLSWIDPETGKVPWYAWGSFGIHDRLQPNSGSFTIRREIASIMRWPTPKAYVFTPYEDYEYCLLLHAATSGGYQIDLPLLHYRKGSSTNAPAELVRSTGEE